MQKLRSFLSVLVLTSLGLIPHNLQAKTAIKIPVAYDEQDGYIRKKMREHLGKRNRLLEIIAGCESTGDPHTIEHWEPDGTLVKNPKSSARGAFQILIVRHSKWISELGLNMKNIDDYMEFLRVIFSTQGYNAWKSSKDCWGEYAYLAKS